MATVTGYTKDAIDGRHAGVFYVEDYGAVGDGTTDDTDAVNSAIAAAVTAAPDNNNYAEVRFQPRTYLIGGNLTQGGDTEGNAQIPLPIIDTDSATVTLALVGSGRGAPNPYFHQTVSGVGGATLKTNLTGQSYSSTYGAPAVIGGPTPEQGWGYNGGGFSNAKFSNMLVVIDGLVVATEFEGGAGTMSGVHLGGVSKARIGDLSCIADATITDFADTSNAPSNDWQCGLYLPQDGNNDNVLVDSFSCYGFYTALFATEHTTVQRLAAIYCYNGIAVHAQAWHGATIVNASVEACQNGIVTSSSQGGPLKPIWVGMLDCEQMSFYTTGGYHISDPSDVLGGIVNIVDPGSGGSDGASISLNGASNVTVNNLLTRSP